MYLYSPGSDLEADNLAPNIPEPGTLALLFGALLGLVVRRRRHP